MGAGHARKISDPSSRFCYEPNTAISKKKQRTTETHRGCICTVYRREPPRPGRCSPCVGHTVQGEHGGSRQRPEFEFQVFLPPASWVPGTGPGRVNIQVPFLPGPGSLTNHTASSTFRDSWHSPSYVKKTPPPYTSARKKVSQVKQDHGCSGRGAVWWEEDIHVQRILASKSPGQQQSLRASAEADLHFMSQQPSSVGQRKPHS